MTQHLTPSQVCKILNCCRTTYYRLLKDPDPLPAYKLGTGHNARWRTDPVELEAWRSRRRHSGPINEETRRKGPQGRKPIPVPDVPRQLEIIIPPKKKRKTARPKVS